MDQQNKKKQNRKDNLKSYAKFSGMAFQMIIILLVFVYGGKFLDEKLEYEKPVFLIIGSLLGIFVALYVSLKDFIKSK